MKKDEFGYFTEGGAAYVVTTPHTPRPYVNMITNDDGYLSEISHFGTSETFFHFPDGNINTVTDKDKKTLYLRDNDTLDVWNPGCYPMMSQVTDFSCKHSDRYTTISSVYSGIKAEWRIFIPQKGSFEIWTVSLTNLSNAAKNISVVPAHRILSTGFAAPRFFDEQVQYSISDFDGELNGMYFNAGNPNPKNARYKCIVCASEKVNSYCGEGEKFLGAPLSMHYPHALINNKDLGNHRGLAGEPFAAVECIASLSAGETKTMDFLIGIVESKDDARQLIQKISSRETVENLFSASALQAEALRKQLWINTPDEKLNNFVNIWLKKGLEYGLTKKDATRDNLQFAEGLTMADAERVKKELERVLTWQYQDGHMLRSWVPLDTVHYADGPLWVVMTTCGYIKFSGDVEFLNKEIPYYDGKSGTVLEHLQRGLENVSVFGPNGIPLVRFADWNDALNLDDEKAESVFMAMALGFMLKELSALMRHIGNEEQAADYDMRYKELKNTVNKVAWDEDGKYYIRGFAKGKIIGGTNSNGSTIFINPQTWSIISGIVTEERLSHVLDAIDNKIETSLGCPVNLPAFPAYDKDFGRISAQLPGTWENGSSYCHVTSFKTYADTLIARGDNALDSLLKVFPDHEENRLSSSGATPFTLTSSYCTNPDIWGKAGRPWLTGTQTWAMRTVVEGLLGIRREYGGFKISPAFPSKWDNANCCIWACGNWYTINIKRTGNFSVKLNGSPVPDGFVAFSSDECTIDVEV